MNNHELSYYLSLGEKIYEVLLKKNEVNFIVCPCSIGDTVNVALHVKRYKELINNDKVVLVIKEQHKSLLKLFPWINVMVFTEIQMTSLRYFIICNGKYDEANILYGHFPPKDLSLNSFDVNEGIPFVHCFKDLMGLSLDSNCDLGNFLLIDEKRKNELYKEYNDSIILFPFAQTLKMIDYSFWINIVRKLKNIGIDNIFTNTINDVIEGTEKSNLGIDELCYVATLTKACVGVRSGIFDAIAATEGNNLNIVLFPDLLKGNSCKFIIPESVHLYFDLRDINSELNVKYYSYKSDVQSEIENQIIQDIMR